MPIANTDHPWHSFDSGIDEILGFYSNQRSCVRQHLRTQLAADRSIQRQYMMAKKPHEPYQKATDKIILNPKWNSAGFFSGHISSMSACDFNSDIRRRISGANNQNGTFLQLRWIAIRQ